MITRLTPARCRRICTTCVAHANPFVLQQETDERAQMLLDILRRDRSVRVWLREAIGAKMRDAKGAIRIFLFS